MLHRLQSKRPGAGRDVCGPGAPELAGGESLLSRQHYHALGDTYRRNGRWEKAKECYLTVLNLADVPGFRLQAIVQGAHVFGALPISSSQILVANSR
jgi:hypothetical protein